jgi:hypothetical protein
MREMLAFIDDLAASGATVRSAAAATGTRAGQRT